MSSITYMLQVDKKRYLDGFPCRHRLFLYCVLFEPLHVKHAGYKHDDLLQHLIGAISQLCQLEPDKPLSTELLLPFFDALHQAPHLFLFLCLGPLQLVRDFLDRHPDVINGEGNPLKYAIVTYRLDVVQELLKRGQDPTWPTLEIDKGEIRGSEAFNALAFMLSGPMYTLEDYKLVCSYMKTVSPDILLHLRRPHQWCPSFIRFLLERGADASHIDNDGCSALHRCLVTTNDDAICLEITQLLVDSGCPMDTPARGPTPLAFAAYHGFTSVVRCLLDRGCQVQENILLLTRGSACFCLLFQRGGIPRADAHLALRSLLIRNWPGRTEGLDIVRDFLDKGGVVPTWTLVVDAVSCDIAAAQHILDSCTNLTGDILLSMLRYIHFCYLPTLAQKMLNSGHPSLELDKLSSVLSKCTEISEWILGRPPLTPNSPSYFEMITFFTRKNAHRLPPDTYKCNDDGATPLHELLDLAEPLNFSAQELLELVRSFVDTGCDILSPDAAGKTPLHLALMLQHGDLVGYLVSKGARFSNVKDLGCIPLKWATHLPWYQTATAAVGCNENSNSIENAASEFDSRETYQFNRTRTYDEASTTREVPSLEVSRFGRSAN